MALCHNCFAQSASQIDSLLLRTHYLNQKEGNIKGAIDIAFKAIEQSKKINYEYGIETGLYTVAVMLSDSRDFKKSIEYIEEAKKYKNFLNAHPGSEFNLLMLQASNNDELGFSSLAASCYHQAGATILKAKPFKKQQYYLMLLYKNAELGYSSTDSQYACYLKAKEIIDQADHIFPKDFPQTEILAKKAEIYGKIGDIHLDEGNLDSARDCYNSMMTAADKLQSDFLKALALASLGKVAEKEEKYDEALAILTKSENVLKNNGIFSNLGVIYNMKQRIYKKTGNKEKEREYLNLSKQLTDSLNNAKDIGRDKMVLNLINEKEAELDKSYTARKNTIILFSVSGMLVLSFGYFIVRKSRKRKEQLLDEQQHMLEKTKEKLNEKTQESELLQQKVQEAREGILVLARENHPEFWQNFRELYPYFREKLLAVNPELKVTELTFCAYIYLGFTTKEIAEYTFKATKTIENNRYNLRKRLGISPETDLVSYLHDLVG